MKSKNVFFTIIVAFVLSFGLTQPASGFFEPPAVKRTLKFSQPETETQPAVLNSISVATPAVPDEIHKTETEVTAAEIDFGKYDPGWQNGQNLYLMNPSFTPLNRQRHFGSTKFTEKPYVFKSENPPRQKA